MSVDISWQTYRRITCRSNSFSTLLENRIESSSAGRNEQVEANLPGTSAAWTILFYNKWKTGKYLTLEMKVNDTRTALTFVQSDREYQPLASSQRFWDIHFSKFVTLKI